MVLRVLIGAACVAIVGYVGFFAFDRFSGHFAAERAQKAARCAEDRENLAIVRSGRPSPSRESARVLEIYVEQCDADDL